MKLSDVPDFTIYSGSLTMEAVCICIIPAVTPLDSMST